MRSIQTIGKRHVHLYLNSSQVHMVVIIPDYHILIRIVPEQRVRSNLNHLVLCRAWIFLRAIAEPFKVVQTYRDNAASLRILNFKMSFVEAILQPVVAIELTNQISLGVNKCKFLGVSGEKHFADVKFKLLLLLGLLKCVEQNVVHCPLSAPNNCLFTVFVKEHGLVLHYNLLLQFQICFPENQNFAFTSNVNIVLTAYRAEHLNRLALAAYACHQPKRLCVEKVDVLRVLPDKLILVALQLVAPRQNQFGPHVLNVGWLEIV